MAHARALKGLLIGSVWIEAGGTFEASPDRLKALVERGHATAIAEGSPSAAAPAKPKAKPTTKPATKAEPAPEDAAAFEVEDFPGGDALAAAGLLTVDAVRDYIAEHGDSWANGINGVGKSTARKIVDRIG